MAKKYNICLDIGGTKILGVIFDQDKNIVYRIKKKTKKDGDSTDNVEKVIISVVEEMLEGSGISKKEVAAIAAGAPGVIDQAKGIILFSPNLPWRNYDIKSSMEKKFGVPFYIGWRNYDIKSSMEKKFGVPFYIGNDVNVGVLGEYKYGAARGYKDVVGFFVGTGMGGGMILNGELYSGHMYKGAEFGHMILDPEGPLCGCGQRGCLEAFSSKQGMSNYIRVQASRGRESMMAEHVQEGVFRSKFLKKALKKQDTVTVEAVDRACHYLAIATGNMINTISPEVVVYGGGVIEAVGQTFLEKIEAEVDRYCMPSIRDTVELKIAELGDDSNIYGALAMIEEMNK